jgi:hypothetical protein
MAGQRGPSESHSLPQTACDPALFTRLDQLAGEKGFASTNPILWYAGWQSSMLFDYRPGWWTDKLYQRIGPKKTDMTWVGQARRALARLPQTAVYIIATFGDALCAAQLNAQGQRDAGVRAVRADKAAKQLAGMLTGSDMSKDIRVDDMALNYLIPTSTTDAGQAVQAYFADTLTLQQCIDYSKLSDVCSVATELAIETGQQRLGLADLTTLYFRAEMTLTDWQSGVRKLGWIDPIHIDWLEPLHRVWPGIGEIYDWMRRGITDGELVASYHLDADFNDAYDDQARKWLRAAGVSSDDARYWWRAQYAAPDPQTMFGLYYRSQAGLLPGASPVTDDDCKQAIALSTIPPAYRDAVFAGRWTYLPGRILKTIYDERLTDEQTVYQHLVAEGIYPADATLQVSLWQQERVAYQRRKVGALTVSAMVSAFSAGTLGTSELLTQATAEGLAPDQVQAVLAAARLERDMKHRGELLAKLKSQYLSGLLPDVAVGAGLAGIGLDSEDVSSLLTLWREELELAPHKDSVGDLTKWYSQGIISDTQFAMGLSQLRYTPADIARVIGSADLVNMSSSLGKAEKLSSGAIRNMTADEKRWNKAIKQASDYHGTANQRTRTKAGAQLAWIKQWVTGTISPVSKRSQGVPPVQEDSTDDYQAAASFVDAPFLESPGAAGIPSAGSATETVDQAGLAGSGEAPTELTDAGLAAAATEQLAEEAAVAQDIGPQTPQS